MKESDNKCDAPSTSDQCHTSLQESDSDDDDSTPKDQTGKDANNTSDQIHDESSDMDHRIDKKSRSKTCTYHKVDKDNTRTYYYRYRNPTNYCNSMLHSLKLE